MRINDRSSTNCTFSPFWEIVKLAEKIKSVSQIQEQSFDGSLRYKDSVVRARSLYFFNKEIAGTLRPCVF